MPRLRLGVALLVPPPVDREIDTLRRALGDRMVGRVPPHLTLVPPLNVREDDLDDALDVLRSAAAVTRPLRVVLGPPATFLPVNPVLYLDVGGEVAGVHAVRDAVFTPPLARTLTFPFVPHVTVLDDAERGRVEAGLAALADYRAEVTFTRVHLLREQRDESGVRVWRPIADMAFEAPAVVGRGGLELELSVTDRLDPQAAAFSERAWEVYDTERFGDLRPEDLVLTARRDGAVVGTLTGWTSGTSCYLKDLIVDEGARREGIGSRLVAAFLSEAAARGCDVARVRTEADGPAESFWRDRGFEVEARFERYTLNHDSLQLRRFL